MSYQAFARKYRPQTFEDVLGQDSIVRTLQNSIEQDRIHQAYLFSGIRGVGKTTAARIFAKALNCEKGPTTRPCNECTICREITEGIDLDVREIDAATYTQVDNIRELREVTQFQPARDRNRVFIIDEAHMLSAGAWNALLKLIEEPPPHVVFIMATTEMHKVPQTILSRVQQFVFRKITIEELVARLREICEAEEIEAENDALEILARRGDGSVRDALSLLDQTIAFTGRRITAAEVATALGLSDTRFFSDIVERIEEGDTSAIIALLDEAAVSGRDFKLLYRDLLAYLRALLLVSSGAEPSLIGLDGDSLETAREVAARFDSSELLRIMNLLLRDDDLVNRSEQQRLVVEVALLRCALLPRLRSVEDVLRSGGSSSAARSARLPKATSKGGASSRTETSSGSAKQRGTGDSIRRFVEEFATSRKIAGNYLRSAASVKEDGDTLRIAFDGENRFMKEQLEDDSTIESLRGVAQEVFARPMEISVEALDAPEPEKSPREKAVEEDPVLRAFAKHLGGEIIK
ncbi:MAG: DNA polymerase III subunit gamma/tau [Thermoanaerobaculia bacterium]|nr:DNA polymerase III subunit gamma/tau [Thermoanaerobaculia bacterium]